MVHAICKEAILRQEFLGKDAIETIYFGGGTPSVLSTDQIQLILNTLRKHFSLSEKKEVTLECNPEDISKEYLERLFEAGINRLSLGVQSFVDDHLKLMNRHHTSSMIVQALDHISTSPFSNFTLDLIYGIPGSDVDGFEQDLIKLLSYNPPHFSTYALTVEERTQLYHQVENGKVVMPEDPEYFAQFKRLRELAMSLGFEHYELSNFAQPGFKAIHNHNYWKGHAYLGLGPSAHSFDGNMRYWNVNNNHKYVKALSSNSLPLTHEHLSQTDKFNEYVITHLRIANGIDFNEVQRKFGPDNLIHLKSSLQKVNMKNEWFLSNTHSIQLSLDGLFMSDYIARELILA